MALPYRRGPLLVALLVVLSPPPYTISSGPIVGMKFAGPSPLSHSIFYICLMLFPRYDMEWVPYIWFHMISSVGNRGGIDRHARLDSGDGCRPDRSLNLGVHDMPMGIVSDDQMESEIKRVVDPNIKSIPDSTGHSDASDTPDIPTDPTNGTNPPTARVVDINRGRPLHTPNRSSEERNQIAEDAIIHGNPFAMDKYDISQSSVSAYKNGATSTSTYHSPDLSLLSNILDVKKKVAGRAAVKLSEALDHITPEKLQSAKLRDIATVAQSMSAVIKNMEPEPDSVNPNQTNVQFVFYSPKIRDEESFEVMNVAE